MANPITAHPLLSYAFRPMFLGLGLFAVLGVGAWIATLGGALPATAQRGPLWHGHEMVFGFALAAVAGFALTAVATWTGRPPVRGGALLALVTAWLIGRVSAFVVTAPHAGSAALELIFPILLTVLVAREILAAANRRNYPVAALVTLFALLDAGYHLGRLGLLPGAERPTLYGGVYALVLLIGVIGGRIVPSFTGNWLRGRGVERLPASTPAVEALVLPVSAATALLAVSAPTHEVTGIAAALAAVLHTVRLARWRGFSTLAEPLLLALHAAYAWLPIGFALLSASVLTDAVPATSALHAFGVGAIGTMVLAVTTRVALGHTGRPLRAARVTVAAYVLLHAAALARIAAPVTGGGYLGWVELSALGWMGAWLLFLCVYAPILLRPRIEVTT